MKQKNNPKCFVSYKVWKIYYEHKKKNMSSEKKYQTSQAIILITI